ncbi:uncharacterized protein BO80DRAFT_202372 [Aspergillus ibericus CBS 121593]|uniref:CDR ABC transporter domain-containing protein n=1 Tax=Aspergillus ibericus CBS 121593 TaxID=1448316 RepID=A0A395H9C4_9EURO|nr:hypothetical protein BO80DRAFT_202372 [Aspergillus ibericus CBS 121593]RAL04517.1 hypothetical protein BO80DRAFT_202372 [Aspergillus ibericus CBS 121593]
MLRPPLQQQGLLLPRRDGHPGYLLNPTATQSCSFCPYSVGDEYARTLHFYYSARGRDAGALLALCVTNFVLLFGVTWLVRVQLRRWRK